MVHKGILMGSRVRKLSLVVKVVDKQTKQMLDHRRCTLTIENYSKMPLIHHCGYFMYMDLDAGIYKVTADAIGYMQESQDIDISILDPLFPVVTIELQVV
jgi:hypothetical protein